MEQQTQINYEEELKKLKERQEYWKPTEGKHKIKFLTEPVDDQFVKDDGQIDLQWRFELELVESKDGMGKRVWKIPKSNSPTSLRGQLLTLGALRKKLINETCTLGVQGKNKERRYTILEVL